MEELNLVIPNNINKLEKSIVSIITKDNIKTDLTIIGLSGIFNDLNRYIKVSQFTYDQIDIWNNNYNLTLFDNVYIFKTCYEIAFHFKLYDYLNVFKPIHRINFEDNVNDLKELNNIISIPSYYINTTSKQLSYIIIHSIHDNNLVWFAKYMDKFYNSNYNDKEWIMMQKSVWYWCCNDGRLDFLIWIYNNKIVGYYKDCMDIAAKNGHLHIIRLLQSWDIQCSKTTLEYAEVYGHRDIVKYLNDQGIN